MVDRPWHRTLVKLSARALLGSSRAHAQDWFPGLGIVRKSGVGEVFYHRAKVADLSNSDRLRDEARENIYIVGSGPSIRDCDLTGLEPKSAILLNGAIGLIGEQIAAPLAVAVEDERFVWRHSEMMRRRIKPGMICLFSVSVLRAISELDSRWLSDKTVLLIDNISKPYGAGRRLIEDLGKLDFVRLNAAGTAGFSSAPDLGVFQGGSVALSALQFALYCTPKTIGFLGIDISNAGEPRFYEASDEAAFSGIARAEGRILEHFILAREIASERGVTFVNYSPVSALLKHGFGYDDRFAAASTI
ncbi:glycosyl transferase [Rhizobium sp.]|uniref:glycosyl transferase n=1 Tax=Rhizobium sp. TaxID=391 RepID=UPI002F159700